MDLSPAVAVERVLRADAGTHRPVVARSSDRAPDEMGAVEWSEALEAVGFLRRWIEEQEAALVAGACRAGWSAAEVARLLGVDRRRVWERFRSGG